MEVPAQNSGYPMADVESLISYIRNNKFIPIPDEERIFTGGDASNYIESGTDALRSLVLYAGLEPSSKVLEVGCGIGRMALPLTQFLTSGQYVGTDIVFHGLAWCNENIASRYSNFSFHHHDIFNEFYNSGGRGSVAEVSLPTVDGGFDVVFLASVFTHLTREDAQAYLHRIYETLAPDGRLWGTWFSVDADIGDSILDGRSKVPVHFKCDDGAFYTTPEKGTLAVAFHEAEILEMLDAAGFKVGYFQRGDWCGPRRQFNGGLQDLIVAVKK